MYRDKNSAVSKYRGKRIYHGAWGTPEAEKSYKRFIATLLESPILTLRIDKKTDVLVSELAVGFLDAHKSRIDKTDYQHYKQAVGHLAKVYGELAVNEFSPKKLKVCRSQMVNTGTLCRNTVNRYVKYIKRIFAWGVEEEIVNANVGLGLRAVKALQEGEAGTFDHPEREAVSFEAVEATLPFLPPTVAAMVQLQYLTAMRPSEVYNMCVGDIDRTRSTEFWYYTPKHHKTEQFVGKKTMPLGKPEQALIAPYLEGKKPTDAVFSPHTAMKERAAEARANRKTKITPSQAERNRQRAKKPADHIGEFYDHSSYRNAVKYAITKGNRHGQRIPHWTPYLLRNAGETAVELEYGLDMAQAQLGHTSANMTKRYSSAQLKQREHLARNRQSPFKSDRSCE